MPLFYVIRYKADVFAVEAYNSNFYQGSMNRQVLFTGTYQGDKPSVPFSKAKFYRSPDNAWTWLKKVGWMNYADVIPINIQEPA